MKKLENILAQLMTYSTHAAESNPRISMVPKNKITMHISITGLKPKGFLGFLKFWRLAIPSFAQAKTAKGNLFCETKRINGHQCTLTSWESREHMLAFMKSGVHLQAMKSFRKIATGRTYGYESEVVPNWKKAFEMLLEKGKEY